MQEAETTDEDIRLSYRLIVTLSSGFQGSHVASEILLGLGHPSKPQKVLDFAAKMTVKIGAWVENLLQELKPLVRANWKSPDSDDARLAWQMIDSLKLELGDVKEISQMIMTVGPAELSDAELSWAVAQFGRHVYSTQDQLLLNMAYGELSKDQQLFASARAGLDGLAPKINEVDSFVDMLSKKGEDLQLRIKILEKVREVHRMTSLQLFDLNIIYNCFRDNYDYHMFGFNQEEAAEWRISGFGPEAAGMWHAFGFARGSEAASWLRCGWSDPTACVAWNDLRFAASEALEWTNFGIGPDMAREWRRAGFSAEKAKPYIEKGMQVPPGKKRS